MQKSVPELRITITPMTEGRYTVLLSGKVVFGDPDAVVDIDVTSQEFQDQLNRIKEDRSSNQLYTAFGACLFGKILPEQFQTSYELIGQSAERNVSAATLRIGLQILAPELRWLPWEVMYNRIRGEWLSTDHRTPFSRYVDSATQPAPKISLPIRVAICSAEPRDLPSVQAKAEVLRLLEILRPLTESQIAQVCTIVNTRRESLCRELERFQPHILHFVGHGAERGQVSGLLLHSANGDSDFLPTDMLCEILGRSEGLQLVVFNACESDRIAYSLAQQGIAAVGMRYAIRTAAAIPFACTLYESIASGMPLDAAVNSARFAIRLECGPDRKDWLLPVTFLPGGVAKVFDIQRPVSVVQVDSKPQGAEIFLDGKATSKTTPDTLIIEDSRSHHVFVEKKGHHIPVPQEVHGTSCSEPQQLSFMLRGANGQHRTLARTNRRRWIIACLLLAIAAWSGVLILVFEPQGWFRFPEVTSQKDTTTTREDSPKESTVENKPKNTEDVVTAIDEADAARKSALEPHNWIRIPSAEFPKGIPNDTTTIRLLRKYGLKQGTAIHSILDRTRQETQIDSFYIDRFEVTNEEYAKFLKIADADNKFSHPDEPPNKDHTPDFWSDERFNKPFQPVVGIDWFDAYAFAQWAEKRLPNEQEWEAAARGQQGLCYPWGNEYSERSYYGGVDVVSGPRPVNKLLVAREDAPVGMAGNVSEWTNSTRPQADTMIVRGGGWKYAPGDVYGIAFLPLYALRESRNDCLGFRCVKDITGENPLPPKGMIAVKGGQFKLGGEDTPVLNLLRRLKNQIDVDAVVKGNAPTLVSIRPFKMQRTEVTNKEYRAFLEYVVKHSDGQFKHPDQPPQKDHTPEFWSDSQFNKPDQPVVGVDWFDAYA
ncbi:MAG: SUMF1/EgtB/PvdO family nonheme iron enzyme, partial [Planctomycetes bacterium]|nr:SUMF1/EgtB/PvdO family nonheme iron enzyme [Planctomycetota bacterium]